MMPAINNQFCKLSLRRDLKHPPCLTAAEATIRQGIAKVVIKIFETGVAVQHTFPKATVSKKFPVETKMLFIGRSHTIQPVPILSLFFNTRLSWILR